jgi:hypothetical protein
MWFKTRVGLSSIKEPFEIRVAKYPEAKKPSYLVFARSLTDSDVQYKGIFGSLKAPGRYVHLAKFDMSEASEPDIAQCMKLIEAAIADEVRICDLSAVGHVDAWLGDASEWYPVKW